MRRLKKIYNIVRGFLFGLLNKEFLIFLFFLFLSGIFWLMMTLNETYERELPVAVRINGVPKNVVITTDISDTMYVTVRDKGFILASYSLSKRIRPIALNFSTYANRQSGHGQIPLSDLQRLVRQRIFASSTIVSVKIEKPDFYFNYGRNKRVKVKLVGNIIPRKNYYLSHVQFVPDKVIIYASAAKLDSINAVFTEYQNVVNFDDTVVKTVRLKAMTGVKIVPQSVKLSLYPDILTEESVVVPITAINKPENLTVWTFPQKVRVHFTVGASVFRTIKSSDFRVVVDYREVAARRSEKCKLYLQNKPRGVGNVRMEMEQVDYLIEQ